MTFWRYTFNARFLFVHALFVIVALTAMLAFYIAGHTTFSLAIITIWVLVFWLSIAGSYIYYRRYKKFNSK